MLKVKLKESVLVNVNKNRCSLKITTLRCKLIYKIVKVRNVNAVSASVTIWKSAYWGPVWKIIGGPAKDPFI
jgi:hypothetical protein